MTRTECPAAQELVRFVDLDLSPESVKVVGEHLCRCQACSQLVQQLRSLVGDLAAPAAIQLDVAAHVQQVMRRLDRQTERPRLWSTARIAAVTALAASVALLVHGYNLHDISPTSTWQSRGGASVESLSRDVGVQVYALSQSLQPVRPGDTIKMDTALTAGLRNLGHASGYVLLFAVDSRNAVHWITPKYAQEGEDPLATELKRTPEERILPTSVVFDDIAEGAVRIITIVSPNPVHVSQVESLSASELALGNLTHRFQAAEVREIAVRAERAKQESTQ